MYYNSTIYTQKTMYKLTHYISISIIEQNNNYSYNVHVQQYTYVDTYVDKCIYTLCIYYLDVCKAMYVYV